MSKNRRRRATPKFFIILTLTLIIMAIAIVVLLVLNNDGFIPIETLPTPTINPEPTPTPTPTPIPIPDPTSTQSTSPETFGLQQEMEKEGSRISEHLAVADLTFPEPSDYTALEGVITFRGNNYRDDPTYGNAGNLAQKKLELAWTKEIPGSIAKSDSGQWFGIGWTGQPLIVRWPKSTVNVMNIYDEKKQKDGLVEIIYATENSSIYFLDLDDGNFTRDKIDGRWTFKGSGSLDPRGYPLLYVGAGDACQRPCTEYDLQPYRRQEAV